MNAVHNSILSPSFVPTLDAAEAIFKAAQAEQERQQAAETQAKQAALQAQREEVRAWLATQIPPEFVPYVDLTEYTPYSAASGHPVQLDIPGAAPIGFHIIRRRSDNDMEFKIACYRNNHAAEMCFSVPFDVTIDFTDGKGNYRLNWEYRHYLNHNNFTLALGAAVSLWREKGEPLMLEIQHLQDQDKENDETIEKIFANAQEKTEQSPRVETIAETATLITRWIINTTTHDLNKKKKKLDKKICKFTIKLANSVDENLAYTFSTLIEQEMGAIEYACFLAGLSYGLCPRPSDTVEDYIYAAVCPIEAANYIQWIGIETRIRQASPQLEAAYRSLDLLIARHKGIEQHAVFLQGIAKGQRLISVVSHPTEI